MNWLASMKLNWKTNAEILARAFGEGSDARIRGIPRQDNPYPKDGAHQHWDAGWWHVQQNWGHGAKGRWYVGPLPDPKWR